MIYFFDGSKEGFLTAFLAAFYDSDAFLTAGQTQLTIGSKTVFVASDSEKAKKAAERLNVLDGECLKELDLLLRSACPDKGQIAYRYFRMIAAEKRPVRKQLSSGAVIDAVECMRRVTTEIHRLKGFVRFIVCESGALYAPITPDNDICDLLAPHFKSRFPGMPFVLHDVDRKKAAVCDGTALFVAPLDKTEILLSADEENWQQLWKKYYETVNIPSRERLRQMRAYMPIRYWKNMPEKK